MMEVSSPPVEGAPKDGPLSKVVVLVVALVAASSVFAAFLNALEASVEDDATRSGLGAQNQASELTFCP